MARSISGQHDKYTGMCIVQSEHSIYCSIETSLLDRDQKWNAAKLKYPVQQHGWFVWQCLSIFLLIFALIEALAAVRDRGLWSVIPKHALVFIFLGLFSLNAINRVIDLEGGMFLLAWLIIGGVFVFLVEKFVPRERNTLKKVVSFMLKIGISTTLYIK